MKLAKHINLPFKQSLQPLTQREFNPQEFGHFDVDPDQLNQDIIQLIEDRGLCFSHWELFYTPPNRHLRVHIDGPAPSNTVKLNWTLGGAGSRMMWWKLKPGRELTRAITIIGTSYLHVDQASCSLLKTIVIGHPTMVNVGVPHSVINRSEPRWCLSGVLGKTEDGITRSIEWDDAEAVISDLFTAQK